MPEGMRQLDITKVEGIQHGSEIKELNDGVWTTIVHIIDRKWVFVNTIMN
jgi:hypothetical protein